MNQPRRFLPNQYIRTTQLRSRLRTYEAVSLGGTIGWCQRNRSSLIILLVSFNRPGLFDSINGSFSGFLSRCVHVIPIEFLPIIDCPPIRRHVAIVFFQAASKTVMPISV